MFIVHRKDLDRTKNDHPVYLYGYGGFNISLTPSFNIFRLAWITHCKGILAIPNIRGGGEYGEDWYKAGIKAKRQNVFDDFQAAAKYLIDEKYTIPKKIAISGGSNGGLLVMTCCNQRPELYGCVIPQVGVLDMLKFHKFTIGYAWVSDYGSADNKDEFETLYKYSPYHNVKNDVEYPSVLITTADHDDRVVPLHSFKMICRLQYTLGDKAFQKNPLLIRIETKAGHGQGKPTSKIIEEVADIYAFICYCNNIKWN